MKTSQETGNMVRRRTIGTPKTYTESAIDKIRAADERAKAASRKQLKGKR